ncbi:MAG: metallophosphoesterase [Candidatus Aenigmatarchaeota archaeon]
MKVLAIGCLHYPNNKESFLDALNRIDEKVDLFLILGDLANDTASYFEVYDKIKDIAKNFIGIFGNMEKNKEEIVRNCKKINFLDDKSMTFGKYLFIGTTGSADENFDEDLHLKRVKFVKEKLKSSKKYYQTILLIHYVPSPKLLISSEKEKSKFISSSSYEKIILENRPNIVFYAHSHFSLPLQTIAGIPFINTSFYVNNGILKLNLI